MKHLTLCLILLFLFGFTRAQQDTLPESSIDIPLQINLRPVYAMAERNVDTVFTSPNYPNDWVQPDCVTRYKYRFRRSPLKMQVNGSSLQLSFMGYYQIIGSTRACVNGTVISPWTPACRCGFDEPERRVQVGFTADFSLYPNLLLVTRINRQEPKSLDKCEVCFWGQDVTTSVMSGLKKELDASKKAMLDSFGSFNLKPYLQRAWNLMSDTYQVPGIGYFQLRPKKLRMSNLNARNDLLNITVGLSASPLITLEKPNAVNTVVPNLSPAAGQNGFSIYLDAALRFDSLSQIMNSYMAGKRFQVSEGLFKKHVIVQAASLRAGENGKLQVRVDFTGSFNGTVYLQGRPEYNVDSQAIEIRDVEYDLATRNLLLKTAKWLFNKKILGEINAYTHVPLSTYYQTAGKTLNDWLNREWTKGIRGQGTVQHLSVEQIQVKPEQLLIRSSCRGQLSIRITDLKMDF